MPARRLLMKDEARRIAANTAPLEAASSSSWRTLSLQRIFRLN